MSESGVWDCEAGCFTDILRLYHSRDLNTVCLVIPCLNEAGALRSNLPRLVAFLQTIPTVRWEIVVVDNGSTDGTQALICELRQACGVSLMVQPERGRGRAIRLAWQSSEADVLAYMDADLAVDLAHLPDLVGPILSGRADVVYGNRFDPHSSVKRSVFRESLSQGYRLLAGGMLGQGIQDYQCGFKAIHAACRDVLLGKVENGHWFFDTELLALASVMGMRTMGIPIMWADRDETRVRFISTIISDIILLVKLRRRLAALSAEALRTVPASFRSLDQP